MRFTVTTFSPLMARSEPHDVGVVERIADRIAVMYRGLVVEEAATDALIAEPLHPYTQALLSAVPIPDPKAETRTATASRICW